MRWRSTINTTPRKPGMCALDDWFEPVSRTLERACARVGTAMSSLHLIPCAQRCVASHPDGARWFKVVVSDRYHVNRDEFGTYVSSFHREARGFHHPTIYLNSLVADGEMETTLAHEAMHFQVKEFFLGGVVIDRDGADEEAEIRRNAYDTLVLLLPKVPEIKRNARIARAVLNYYETVYGNYDAEADLNAMVDPKKRHYRLVRNALYLASDEEVLARAYEQLYAKEAGLLPVHANKWPQYEVSDLPAPENRMDPVLSPHALNLARLLLKNLYATISWGP